MLSKLTRKKRRRVALAAFVGVLSLLLAPTAAIASIGDLPEDPALPVPVITHPAPGVADTDFERPLTSFRVTANLPESEVAGRKWMVIEASFGDNATGEVCRTVAPDEGGEITCDGFGSAVEGRYEYRTYVALDRISRSAPAKQIFVRWVDDTAPDVPSIDHAEGFVTPDEAFIPSGVLPLPPEPQRLDGDIHTVNWVIQGPDGYMSESSSTQESDGTFKGPKPPAQTGSDHAYWRNGNYTVLYFAEDRAHNRSATVMSRFIVAAPPKISGPAQGAIVGEVTPTITGTGAEGSTITVIEDAMPLCTATVVERRWSCSSSELTPGEHTVSASQQDAVTAPPLESEPVTFTVSIDADTTPVSITTPRSGSSTSTEPTVQGIGEQDATVKLEADGETVGITTVDENGAWTIPVMPELAPGVHHLTATQDADHSTDIITIHAKPRIETRNENVLASTGIDASWQLISIALLAAATGILLFRKTLKVR